MNASNSEETIFAEARRLPPEDRATYLSRICCDDASLRRRIEALLNAAERSGAFLEISAAHTLLQTSPASTPLAEKPGDKVGRYKLLQQIGEGGCGVVYMAEQEEPVRRRVALKVIKVGMDTRSVIARFEAERQALAMMEHPNIAKVLDAGATETGRPYFVMELVRGMKITDYCDEAKLSTRQRLDLFMQVCQAIQHAHQKGIIHRDIKPSNILVTVNDGVAVPKVIDFGIAKATGGQQLTDKTVFTAFEQFIGTPAYMSPEQAVMTSLDIDTRSDIYALGVLLYELLTGKTPFDTKKLLAIGLDEMRRTIRETEPARPSMCVSTLPDAERSTTAQRRGLDAPKLASLLRGDLDWIVMKALEKDRARRYETANVFAMDIQRHLDNEPVVACPPSNLYRFRKMVWRNKLLFTAGSSVVLALVVGLGAATWMFLKEREALKRAVAAEQAERKLRQEAELRELNARALQLGTYFNWDEAEIAYRAALDAQRKSLGKDHPDVADSLCRLARVFGNRRNFSEAEAALREAMAIRKKSSPEGDLATAEMLQQFASILDLQDKTQEAEEMYKATIDMRRTVQGEESVDVALTMNNLAALLSRQKRRTESLSLYRQAFVSCRKSLGDGDPRVALVAENLISSLTTLGHRSEAEALVREVIPPNIKSRPSLSKPVAWLTDEMFKTGTYQDGEQLLNDLVSKAPDNVDVLGVRAQFLARGERFEAASADYRRIIKLEPNRHLFWHEHAAILAFGGRLREHDEHCQQFLKQFSGSLDPEALERAAKASLLLPSSEHIGAAIELADRLDVKSSSDGSWIACLKGLAEYRRRDFGVAIEYLRQASESYRPSACKAQACAVLAMAHHQLSQTDEARSVFARAEELERYGMSTKKKGEAYLWADWLRAFVLIREARAMIAGGTETPPQAR